MITQLKKINSGVPQSNMLGLMLHLLSTADLPVALDTITYVDDAAILAVHNTCRSIPALTKKLLLHPKMAKEMGNQS